MAQIPFALETYISRARPVSSQRLVNMYSELQPEEVNAKSKVVLFGAPGLVQFATVGTGPIRAMHILNEYVYVVSGSQFYRLASDGSSDLLGSGILAGTGPVSMDDNGVEVGVVDGQAGFIYNSDNLTWQQISDVNFYPANTISHNETYFLFDRKNTNQFFSSDSIQGLIYNPLFYGTAESLSDYVLATINHLQQLIVAGQRSIEIWYLAGGENFPWAKYTGAAIQIGMAGPLAWTKVREALLFIGNDRNFYRLEGVNAVRVSKHGTEQEWANYGDISDAFCFSITWEGHDFIYVTFPSVPKTWCFDLTTGLWHERESTDSGNQPLGRWRANCAVAAFNKQLIGDYESNVIGYQSSTDYTEYGNTIKGLAQGSPMHKNGNRVFMPRFELDIEAGMGLTTGQGSDPQLVLSLSDDGGYTFNQVRWASMGRTGQYNARLRWCAMGSFYQRTMKLEVSDPIRRTIISSFVDLEADE